MLSGTEIMKQVENGKITIEPFNKEQLNPNSYNLYIGDTIYMYEDSFLDLRNENNLIPINIPEEGYMLHPNKVYLTSTKEIIGSKFYVPEIATRSSAGRLGLSAVLGDFGDVGFKGNLTLQLTVIQNLIIYPNCSLAQVHFDMLDGSNEIQYDGRYKGNGCEKSKGI